jgi:hypothetical protein
MLQIVRDDPENETACAWLSEVATDVGERFDALFVFFFLRPVAFQRLINGVAI